MVGCVHGYTGVGIEDTALRRQMSTREKPVLVTGGAGFIGSHTCKALAAQGYLPIAFDDMSKGHVEFVRWGP
jgi:FlaA1/EpsC-like NDP-sugar epimerase